MPPCHLPPGRELEIMNCLPVIPPGLWPRFVATGEWPPGIEQGLARTKDCPWATQMAQFRESAVVVDGQVVRLASPVVGLLPAGWYRYWLTTPQPVDPVETVARYREVIRAPLTTRAPVAGGDIAAPCLIQPVPTLDFLMPYPFDALPSYTLDGQLMNVQPGDFGAILWRLFGSDHGLFSTGFCAQYVLPQFLSPLGLRWLEKVRNTYATDGLPGSILVAAFAEQYLRSACSPGKVLRHYQASHMQCLTPLHYADGRRASWRWRLGGARPAARAAHETPDIFDVETSPGSGVWRNSTLALRPYLLDEQGAPLAPRAAEYPFGENQVNGPAPGAYIVPS